MQHRPTPLRSFLETFKKTEFLSKNGTLKIKEETFHVFFFQSSNDGDLHESRGNLPFEGNHQISRRFCPASEALISRVSSCWCWVLEVWHEGIQKHRRWAVWPRCPADDGGKLRSLWEVDQLSRWRCLLGIFLPSNWWVLTTAGITFSLVFVSRCLWQATFFRASGWLVKDGEMA